MVLYSDIDSEDSEAQDIDIDNMLDEGLPDDLRERKKMHQYEEKSKLVLEGLFEHFLNISNDNSLKF